MVKKYPGQGLDQRALNVLQSLSRRPLIWPLPNPFSPLPRASKLSLFLSLPFRVCRRSVLLPGEGAVVGEEPNHTTARKSDPLLIIQYSLAWSRSSSRGGWGRRQIIRRRESLVLYKSFNTPWSGSSSRCPLEEHGATVRMVPLPCLACQLPVWCSDLTDVVTLGTQQ